MANAVNFNDLEFEDLIQLIKDRLKTKKSWEFWSDGHFGSTANTLLDAYAHFTDILIYVINQRNKESFFPSARLRTSMVALAQLINYRPANKTASQAPLVISLANGARAVDVIVPAGARFESTTGITFTTKEQHVIPAGHTSINAIAYQGRLTSGEVVSTGLPFQRFEIQEPNIAEGHLVVEVIDGGVTRTWHEYSNLFHADDPDKRYFRLESPISGEGLIVIFGDGSWVTDPATGVKSLSGWGQIPPVGATIRLSYLVTDGQDGNVLTPGAIQTALSPGVDALDPTLTVPLSVTNTSPAVGGKDRESVENIRNNAPAVFRSNNRLVTREDWNFLVRKYPGVAYAYCWGEGDMSVVEQQTVKDGGSVARVCVVNSTFTGLDGKVLDLSRPVTEQVVASSDPSDTPNWSTTMDQFRRYLDVRKLLNDRYEIVPPAVINTKVKTTAYIERTSVPDTISGKIKTDLTSHYTIDRIGVWQNRINLSDVVTLIDSIEGVKYNHTEIVGFATLFPDGGTLKTGWAVPQDPSIGQIKVYRADGTVQTAYATYTTHLAAETILDQSVEVYVSGVLALKEHPDGSLRPVSKAYDGWGGIVYRGASAVSVVVPNGATASSLVVEHKTSTFQDVIGRKHIVCRLAEVVATAKYAD